jgi:type I restriction enzyme M protein
LNALTKSDKTRYLVDLLWNYRLVLRDDGLSSIDYVEQLTLLLVLKMAQEHADRNDGRDAPVPAHLGWLTVLDADPEEFNEHYEMILEELGIERDGAVGLVFHGAENKIRNTTSLKTLISDVIDKVNWSDMGVDIMGDVYEALLTMSVDDTRGAGQYFTPRALVETMVNCVQPEPDDTIVDPTSGTGGYLVAAHRYIVRNCGNNRVPEYPRTLRDGGIRGVELVPSIARLAQMNLLLHGMGTLNGRALIKVGDALARPAENSVSSFSQSAVRSHVRAQFNGRVRYAGP